MLYKYKYIIFSILFLVCNFFTEIIVDDTLAEEIFRNGKSRTVPWQLIGPGDADQVTSISVSADGAVYVGTDNSGIYYSNNKGEEWSPLNNGIKNYDITTPVLIDSENKNIRYVGTSGGFYKSIDSGKTWQAKWRGVGEGKPAYARLTACVGSIAIDPENPDIIYMGFGHRFGHRPICEKSRGIRGDIYKSIDKGETWKVISKIGEGVNIRHIHTVTSEIIYVASNIGLFKSNDAGKSWEKILSVPVRYVVTHPKKSEVVYVAAGEEGVFKSADSGLHWTKINKGLGLGVGKPEHTDTYTQIEIDVKNPETIYTISTTWGGGGGVYRSLNGGESWEKITRWKMEMGLPQKYEANVEEAWLSTSRKVNAIALDPHDVNRIYIGTSRYIYKTEDGGNSWQQLISRKVTNDTWTHRGINAFGHTRVVGVDPVDPNKLYIGTADHGLVKSIDGGKTWKESVKGMEYKANIYDVAIDTKKPQVVYVINGKVGFKVAGVAKSYDFGESWVQLNKGLRETVYYTLLPDPDNSNILYIGGEDGVYKTEDGGQNWVLKNKGLENITVRKLLFHPNDKDIIFAATNRGLYKSSDGGNIWGKTHFSEIDIFTIIIDPSKPNIIFAGAALDGLRKVHGGVFKSIDGGKKWKRVLNIRWVYSMTLIPVNPAIIYALSNDFAYHDESAGDGVFRSVDGGFSWEKVNDGLAVLRGFSITTAPYSPYKLYLSSNGSGVYTATDTVFIK